jgi:uncharacterized protein (TIGR04255 family)
MVLTGAFTDEEVPRYHLPRAPLVRVIAQARFPKQPELASADGIASLRDALRHDYPILREERVMGIVINTDGVTTQPEPNPVWRLQDPNAEWQVSVSDSFVALDTSAYDNRSHFCARVNQLIEAVHATCNPIVLDRLGLRYIDRFQANDEIANLPRWLRPEVLSGLGLQSDTASVQQVLCQTNLNLADAQAIARWALLPPSAIIDPAVPVVPTQSWILDLDVFRAETVPFDPSAISELTTRLAHHAYRFFLWAITPEFLVDRGVELQSEGS